MKVVATINTLIAVNLLDFFVTVNVLEGFHVYSPFPFLCRKQVKDAYEESFEDKSLLTYEGHQKHFTT